MPVDEDSFESRIQYYGLFFDRVTSAARLLPWVVEEKARLEWVRDTWRSAPQGVVGSTEFQNAGQEILDATDRVKDRLPVPPAMDPATLGLSLVSSSSALSGTIGLISCFMSAGSVEDPETVRWATARIDSYRHVQEQEGREQGVRRLLARLEEDCPTPGGKVGLADEFTQAVASVGVCRQLPAAEHKEAALLLRNVHDHYKGKLLNKARTFAKENQPTWWQMSQRFRPAVAMEADAESFRKEEDRYRRFMNELSGIAKGSKPANVWGLYTEWLEHVYGVLSYVYPEMEAGTNPV